MAGTDKIPETLTVKVTPVDVARIDRLLGPGAKRASFAAVALRRGLDAMEEDDRKRLAAGPMSERVLGKNDPPRHRGKGAA